MAKSASDAHAKKDVHAKASDAKETHTKAGVAAGNTVIKAGDKVAVDYTGTLDDGSVFDSTTHESHSHPLEFNAGTGQLIEGFDKAVIGMKVGEEKTFKLTPEQAYGLHNPQMIKKLPRKGLPASPEPKVGMMIGLRTPDGQEFPAAIAGVDKETITIDLNHPLAGKALTFKIKIVGINAPSTAHEHHH
jgi:FKBP-type peptidyl-prolyl cis-trans isomerase 2